MIRNVNGVDRFYGKMLSVDQRCDELVEAIKNVPNTLCMKNCKLRYLLVVPRLQIVVAYISSAEGEIGEGIRFSCP
jgi:hypothetical protein